MLENGTKGKWKHNREPSNVPLRVSFQPRFQRKRIRARKPSKVTTFEIPGRLSRQQKHKILKVAVFSTPHRLFISSKKRFSLQNLFLGRHKRWFLCTKSIHVVSNRCYKMQKTWRTWMKSKVNLSRKRNQFFAVIAMTIPKAMSVDSVKSKVCKWLRVRPHELLLDQFVAQDSLLPRSLSSMQSKWNLIAIEGQLPCFWFFCAEIFILLKNKLLIVRNLARKRFEF